MSHSKITGIEPSGSRTPGLDHHLPIEASTRPDFTGPQHAPVARGVLPASRLTSAGTPSPYDATLTVDYVGAPAGTGPCSGEYTAHAVEGTAAVVVVVQPMVRPRRILDEERAVSCDPPLSPSGPYRQQTVYLSRSLGERVLLDLDGDPLMVTHERA